MRATYSPNMLMPSALTAPKKLATSTCDVQPGTVQSVSNRQPSEKPLSATKTPSAE